MCRPVGSREVRVLDELVCPLFGHAEADVVVYDRLASPALLELAPARAERVYVGKEPGRSADQPERSEFLCRMLAG